MRVWCGIIQVGEKRSAGEENVGACCATLLGSGFARSGTRAMPTAIFNNTADNVHGSVASETLSRHGCGKHRACE